MSPTLSPALQELAYWLLRHEAELIRMQEDRPRIALSEATRAAVLVYLPEIDRERIRTRILSDPIWEEVLESRDPALLQQASWVAENAGRPYLAQDFAVMAEIVEESATEASDSEPVLAAR
ncbi:hypothetical protein [Thiomonas sp.]